MLSTIRTSSPWRPYSYALRNVSDVRLNVAGRVQNIKSGLLINGVVDSAWGSGVGGVVSIVVVILILDCQ